MTAQFPSARLLRRFRKSQDGATAVEFSLVAIPFFMLLFGIIELGMVMLVSSAIDEGLAQTARTVRTGQVTTTNSPSVDTLKTTMCGKIAWLGASCMTKLTLDVRIFANFGAVTPPPTPSVANPPQYNTGAPCSVVLVTATYPWTVFAPVLSSALVNNGGSSRLITSAVVFRNEPYVQGASC